MEKELDGVKAGDFVLIRRRLPHGREFIIRDEVLRTTKTIVYSRHFTFNRDGYQRGTGLIRAQRYDQAKDQTEDANLFITACNLSGDVGKEVPKYLRGASKEEIRSLIERLSAIMDTIKEKAP